MTESSEMWSIRETISNSFESCYDFAIKINTHWLNTHVKKVWNKINITNKSAPAKHVDAKDFQIA